MASAQSVNSSETTHSSNDSQEDHYVLIVDDNHDSQDVLAQVLTLLGLRYRACFNGQEALKAIKEEVPSLILLDLMMPEMNGFSFLTKLRGSNRTQHDIPVIVFSAVSNGAAELLKIRGVVNVVQKGHTTITELQEAIQAALSIKTTDPA